MISIFTCCGADNSGDRASFRWVSYGYGDMHVDLDRASCSILSICRSPSIQTDVESKRQTSLSLPHFATNTFFLLLMQVQPLIT